MDGEISQVEWSALPEALMTLHTLNNGPIMDAAESFDFWKRKWSERTPDHVLGMVRSGIVDSNSAIVYCMMAFINNKDERIRCAEKVWGVGC